MERLIDYTFLEKEHYPYTKLEEFVHNAVLMNYTTICVYPEVLPTIYAYKLKYDFFPKICTVINFPSGTSTADDILKKLNRYNLNGVEEIDVVWNYRAWGTCGIGYDPIESIEPIQVVVNWCRNSGREIIIKVILETGYLLFPDQFNPNSNYQNLRNGIYWILSNFSNTIHFLKTSTGKSEYGGATIEAVETMIDCIKEFNLENKIGIKVSGGIKTKDKVYDYLYLFEELDWNGEIRFGTSSAF